MLKRILCLILFITPIFSYLCQGQISYGGSPASFTLLKSLKSTLPVIGMSPVNNEELQLKDIQSKEPNKKYRFAVGFDVDISPDNSGVWDQADGVNIWRVAILSKGAYSLNILFDRAILPTGASIFIYSPDHTILRGAFTANNEQSSGMLPVSPLPGEEIIVEYNEPVNVSTHGDLHISRVNHDYKNMIGRRPLGESGACNMDVYCWDAMVMAKEKQAVVQLVIAGMDLCTGTLVNNTSRDKTPYLITAGHCILTAKDAQQTVFTFNYESSFCGTNGSLNGYIDQSMTGSILRARSDSLDFALVELEMPPPPSYRPYYAGWDHSLSVSPYTRTVHHPKGDVKKVSIDSDAPGIATYSATGRLNNSFWLVKKWDIGTTEAGSSGCPLFNNANLIIGSLTGGTATCENSINDYFAMFHYQWDYSSPVTKQLKRWLDPSNTGEYRIESIDPIASGSACNQISDVSPGEKYELVKINNGKGYVSGHNSLRITSYAQEFDQTEKTTISAFSAGFAKAISGVNNTNSTVEFQFYKINENSGLPGVVLKTIKLPISSLKAGALNFFVLDQPLEITGKFFIGYNINYSNTSDSIALYHAPQRFNNDNNKAFCFVNGSWQPFYWVPEINLKTSLLINAYGCSTTFAQTPPAPVPVGNSQFKVYYPTDFTTNLLYLVNTGKEEYGRVIFYDIMGRKISENERMLTTTPMELNCSALESSVYCIAVETSSKREVMKVKVIRSR
ncbi:MAG: hypothetical protein WCP08_14010 [Prolixibacteraceae bacterium]